MFNSLELYYTVSEMLAQYNFRITSRRFIQELFHDVAFNEVWNGEICVILSHPYKIEISEMILFVVYIDLLNSYQYVRLHRCSRKQATPLTNAVIDLEWSKIYLQLP